jgi:predicted permease
MVRAWAMRLAGLFRRDHQDHEIDAEMESHLQMHIDDNIRDGMTAKEARRLALMKLGGVEQTKQIYRERNTVPFVDHLTHDLRFSIRQLAKNPGFTFTAIVMLALGMGASVAIFGFVDAALIKPLPFPNPSGLVHVTESVAMIQRANLSYPDYLDWKKMNKVFRSLDVFVGTGYTLRNGTGTELVSGVRVSDGFFHTLGIAPALGRDFYSGEDLPGTANTVILSFNTWQNRFAGRKDVIGQTVLLSGTPNTIIGVLPKDFQFALRGPAEFWAPLHPAGSCDLRRSCHGLEGVARLKEGVSVETALANMKSIAKQLEMQYPGDNRGQGASVLPLSEVIVGDIRPMLLMLLCGAGLLLVIACVNVASLLLVRSESRKREIAVRGALGASSARLIQQFAIEGLVLVALGTGLGLISAHWGIQLLTKLIPADMIAYAPYLQGLGLNLHSLAFACTTSLLAAALFSVTPLVRLPFASMREGLAEGSRGSAGTAWRRLGSNLVVVELAIAVVLLVGAGLLGQSFYRLLHVDLGFRPDHLATIFVAAPDTRYGKDEQAMALARQVVSQAGNLPGVKSAGLASVLAASFNGNTDWIRFVGKPYHGEHNEVNEREVSSDYLRTLGAKLLRGRYFTDAEDQSKPRVVIINRALATKYFPGEDPIGKRIGDDDLSPKSIKEIIGIVDDFKEGALDSEIWPAVYYPLNQFPETSYSLLVRTSQDEQALLPALRKAVRQIDPDIATRDETTMIERIANSQTAYWHRSSAWLVGGFAALALLLSVVGLYGVVAYSVSQRTREIGVRMALGAQPHKVYRLILMEAARLTGVGIAAGLLCSLAAATLMRKLLFGVESWDLSTLAGVAVALGAAALLASFIPARRAASLNPVDALRAE